MRQYEHNLSKQNVYIICLPGIKNYITKVNEDKTSKCNIDLQKTAEIDHVS